MKKSVKAFFFSDWTTSEKTLLLADVLLLGVLIGWLTSPLKSLSFFSNNFSSNRKHFGAPGGPEGPHHKHCKKEENKK